MARIYLETSFVSACVTNRTSLRSIYEREASLNWWTLDAARHELFVSDEVLSELSHPDYPQSEAALDFIRSITVLSILDEMVRFAAILVDRKVMPRPVAGDALHVATAVVSHMEYILTWNVRHLANPNKSLHLNAICTEHGYLAPRIVRPDDLEELDR